MSMSMSMSGPRLSRVSLSSWMLVLAIFGKRYLTHHRSVRSVHFIMEIHCKGGNRHTRQNWRVVTVASHSMRVRNSETERERGREVVKYAMCINE